MSRRPAILTQADFRRAIAAAKQAGAVSVDILPDGTVRAVFSPINTDESMPSPLEQAREIVL